MKFVFRPPRWSTVNRAEITLSQRPVTSKWFGNRQPPESRSHWKHLDRSSACVSQCSCGFAAPFGAPVAASDPSLSSERFRLLSLHDFAVAVPGPDGMSVSGCRSREDTSSKATRDIKSRVSRHSNHRHIFVDSFIFMVTTYAANFSPA